MERIERYFGSLLGLTNGGDAIGTTLEFKPLGSFKPIEDMLGGGLFHLEPGLWTDDTSMALCLAESLILGRALIQLINLKESQMVSRGLYEQHGKML